MSLGAVQRAAARVRQARVSAELTEVPADPVLSLLTAGDVEHLGVSATDVVGGLTPLDRYRVLGLPAGTAGDAARALFDHGRGAEAWHAWLHAGTVCWP